MGELGHAVGLEHDTARRDLRTTLQLADGNREVLRRLAHDVLEDAPTLPRGGPLQRAAAQGGLAERHVEAELGSRVVVGSEARVPRSAVRVDEHPLDRDDYGAIRRIEDLEHLVLDGPRRQPSRVAEREPHAFPANELAKRDHHGVAAAHSEEPVRPDRRGHGIETQCFVEANLQRVATRNDVDRHGVAAREAHLVGLEANRQVVVHDVTLSRGIAPRPVTPSARIEVDVTRASAIEEADALGLRRAGGEDQSAAAPGAKRHGRSARGGHEPPGRTGANRVQHEGPLRVRREVALRSLEAPPRARVTLERQRAQQAGEIDRIDSDERALDLLDELLAPAEDLQLLPLGLRPGPETNLSFPDEDERGHSDRGGRGEERPFSHLQPEVLELERQTIGSKPIGIQREMQKTVDQPDGVAASQSPAARPPLGEEAPLLQAAMRLLDHEQLGSHGDGCLAGIEHSRQVQHQLERVCGKP